MPLRPVLVLPLALAACSTPPDPAKVVATAAFTSRLVGHWQRAGDPSCAAGPNVTLDRKNLIVTIAGARTVHRIDQDDVLAAHTTVLEPASNQGQTYMLTPEFNATSDKRSFNLIVRNLTTGARENWAPCEP
jgi:hypothetical protein